MGNIFEAITTDPVYGKIATIIFGIILINIIVHFLQRTLSRYIPDKNTRFNIRRGLTFLGYIGSVIFIVSVIGNQLNSLAVTLGVAGAGIAFALQEVIMSVAGWIAISLGQFYHIGDRIELNSVKGDVIEIGMLRTTVMEIGEWVSGDLYSGRIVRLPNSYVFKESVFNYTADFPFLWDEIKLPIKYGSDYALTREILAKVSEEVIGEYAQAAQQKWEKLVRKYAIEEARIAPMVTLIANDNWAEFTLRYVVDYKKRRSVKDQIFMKLLKEIEQTDGKIGIASATVHLVETPVFDVRVENKKQN